MHNNTHTTRLLSAGEGKDTYFHAGIYGCVVNAFVLMATQFAKSLFKNGKEHKKRKERGEFGGLDHVEIQKIMASTTEPHASTTGKCLMLLAFVNCNVFMIPW
jgi:hypothetical protein